MPYHQIVGIANKFNILQEKDFIPLAHILDEDEYEFMTYNSLIDLENESYSDHEDWLKPYIIQMVDFSIKNRNKKTELLIDSIDRFVSGMERPSFQFYIDCVIITE